MMGWKKRSRGRWRGVSPLSAMSITCGIVFLMGNLYILHSGFSQAYRDMAAYDDDDAVPEVQGTRTSGAGFMDSGVLEGLPILALEALGYIAGGGVGSGGRKTGGVDLGILKPQMDEALHGFGEARLRKLMGNRRDWAPEAQHGRQHGQQPIFHLEDVKKASNTGHHRTNHYLDDGKQVPSNKPTGGHQQQPYQSPGHSSNTQHKQDDTALYYQPSNHLAPLNGDRVDPGAHTLQVTSSNINAKTPRRVMDVPAVELRRLLSGGSRCGYVQSLTGREYVGSGWTKTVYRADDPGRGEAVAIKTVDLGGHDMSACAEKYGMGPVACYHLASQKLLKEMLLLQSFNNPHIIKMLGYCVPQKPYNGDADSLVAMVTELGETIDIIKLLQMSWEDRLRVCYGVTRLLKYLADSPFGSVALNDFRRQQFVLVRDDVTLTDLDDVGFEEPTCKVPQDCIHYFSSANFTLRTPCVKGRCQGYNEKKNVFNAARHFTTFLLPHGAPPSLRPAIDAIIHAYSNATLRAGQLLEKLDKVVERYKKGDYIQRSPEERVNKYIVSVDVDLPGLYDYKCRYSIAAGCTLSVLDQREAEQLCDLDPECKAFIISNRQTWTGRMIVHLKNNITSPSTRPGMSLCIKPGL